MTTKEIRAKIREIKKEMRTAGVKRKSCFNAGLTPDEYRYNAALFALETQLSKR